MELLSAVALLAFGHVPVATGFEAQRTLQESAVGSRQVTPATPRSEGGDARSLFPAIVVEDDGVRKTLCRVCIHDNEPHFELLDCVKAAPVWQEIVDLKIPSGWPKDRLLSPDSFSTHLLIAQSAAPDATLLLAIDERGLTVRNLHHQIAQAYLPGAMILDSRIGNNGIEVVAGAGRGMLLIQLPAKSPSAPSVPSGSIVLRKLEVDGISKLLGAKFAGTAGHRVIALGEPNDSIPKQGKSLESSLRLVDVPYSEVGAERQASIELGIRPQGSRDMVSFDYRQAANGSEIIAIGLPSQNNLSGIVHTFAVVREPFGVTPRCDLSAVELSYPVRPGIGESVALLDSREEGKGLTALVSTRMQPPLPALVLFDLSDAEVRWHETAASTHEDLQARMAEQIFLGTSTAGRPYVALTWPGTAEVNVYSSW